MNSVQVSAAALHGGTPRLLVSVRSAQEACAALAGGCDILDVKEPSRGSLGRPDPRPLRDVIAVARQTGVPVSAALGEILDTIGPRGSSGDVLPADCLTELSWWKIGPAGLADRSDWRTVWRNALHQIDPTEVAGRRGVVVAYADASAAQAPSPGDVAEFVERLEREGGLRPAGVLVDTWSKSGGRLLDHIRLDDLLRLRAVTRECGGFLALAGRLTATVLPALAAAEPDIIAIRSAACVGERREATVDAAAVRAFRQALSTVWPREGARGAVS